MKTLVLGIGNLLMGDEGVGIHVVNYLKNNGILPGIDLVDGGTGGFHLLEYFQSYERVILIDATIDGRTPGTISRLEPKFSSDYPVTLTAHDIGLKDLLDALYLTGQQPKIVLYTVSIANLNLFQTDLSPQIEAAVSPAADAVKGYLLQQQ